MGCACSAVILLHAFYAELVFYKLYMTIHHADSVLVDIGLGLVEVQNP